VSLLEQQGHGVVMDLRRESVRWFDSSLL
jgi:hypothetical protein